MVFIRSFIHSCLFAQFSFNYSSCCLAFRSSLFFLSFCVNYSFRWSHIMVSISVFLIWLIRISFVFQSFIWKCTQQSKYDVWLRWSFRANRHTHTHTQRGRDVDIELRASRYSFYSLLLLKMRLQWLESESIRERKKNRSEITVCYWSTNPCGVCDVIFTVTAVIKSRRSEEFY